MKRLLRVNPSGPMHRPRLSSASKACSAILAVFVAFASLLVVPVGRHGNQVEAAGTEGWAYVLTSQSIQTTATYAPSWTHQFNSTGEKNTVTQTGTGRYTVRLPKLGARAGSVHVSPFANPIAGEEAGGPGSCSIEKWGPTSGDQYIWVRCFDLSGRATDGAFTLTYTNITSSPKPMAYLLADKPTPSPSTYTPNPIYQFNSKGATNTVTWTGGGRYKAHLPRLASKSGYVQVTAFGGQSGRCQVAGWGPAGTSQDVDVRCFNGKGVETPMKFTLTYVQSISLVGSSFKSDLSGTSSAYVLASKPSSASYTPAAGYAFNSQGGTNTIRRASVGVYQVNFADQQLERGIVQLSVFGKELVHCKATAWGTTVGLQVRCFTRTGTPKDAAFQATILNSTGLRQHLAVPSYFDDPDLWDDLTGNAPRVGLAVINNNNGPGTVAEDVYTQQLDQGITVLGYVYTARGTGTVPLDKAIADVNKFYELYPKIDGIFLDVVSTDCSLVDPAGSYYKVLSDSIRSKPGQGKVIINPGGHTKECYMDAADIVINFESYYIAPSGSNDASYAPGQAHSWRLLDWEKEYPPAAVLASCPWNIPSRHGDRHPALEATQRCLGLRHR